MNTPSLAPTQTLTPSKPRMSMRHKVLWALLPLEYGALCYALRQPHDLLWWYGFFLAAGMLTLAYLAFKLGSSLR